MAHTPGPKIPPLRHIPSRPSHHVPDPQPPAAGPAGGRPRAAGLAGGLRLVLRRGHRPRSLKWYGFLEPSGAFEDGAGVRRAPGGRYPVVLAWLPADADQQREQLARRLAARDDALDLLGMDVIWTAEMAEAGWLLPWEGEAVRRVSDGTLAPAVAAATWRGRLWAAPFTSNAQLLWVRGDLVPEPPATWDRP